MSSYIIANWKMNASLKSAYDFCMTFKTLYGKDKSKNRIVLCPPSPYLLFLNGALSGTDIALGAQDCSGASRGAFTGEISAEMVKDVGCTYVIIGHSERRHNHQESDSLLSSKIQQALDADLKPIFCIGENEGDFDAGNTKKILKDQLSALRNFKNNPNIIIAYEPVWAIGTGKVACLQDIENTCLSLKKELFSSYHLTSPLLYGGSVKGSNAQEILSLDSVDGVLVGGASLDPQEFWRIAQ